MDIMGIALKKVLHVGTGLRYCLSQAKTLMMTQSVLG